MELLFIAALLTAAPQVQAQTLSGDAVAGSLAELNNEAVTIVTADGERKLPIKELLGVSLPTTTSADDKPPAAWIALADGSRLQAKTFAIAGGEVKVTLRSGATITAPTGALAIDSVEFREHTGPLAEQWAEIARADRSADLLVVRKNDALDFLSGVIRDVNDETVQFELDGETLKVKRTKVDGLLYGQAGRKPSQPTYCTLADAAGSQFRVASLSSAGETLRMRTGGGVEIAWPAATVARIDYSQGNLQYLGDLKPETLSWTPYFGDSSSLPGAANFFRPRADRALDGGPLRLGGREYAKGIAAQSRSEIVYRLPERYRVFQTTLGIDDRLRPGGNVRLAIYGDDRVLFDEAISGRDEPRAVEIDITGVNRLKLSVDFGEDLDVGDALDLCDARILK